VKNSCKPFINLVSVEISALAQLAKYTREFERTGH
jgi:hypothetical protein